VLEGRGKLLAAGGLFVALLVVVSVMDGRGFRRYLRLQQDVQSLQERNRVVAEQNAALQLEVERLKREPRALERAVREELGYVKPGEIVINVE
jgi:cell division protein FtsB